MAPLLEPGAPPQRSRVRRSLPLLVLVAVVATMGPGLLVYAGLRTAGLGIGGSGVVAILVMMAAMTGFAGWLFGGGRRGQDGAVSTDA